MLNCRYGIIGIVGGWLTSEVFDILERDFRELIIRETGVIPFFTRLRDEGAKELPITDMRMTRFNISLEAGVAMVMYAIGHHLGGEIFIPKIPSYRICDVATAIAPNLKQVEVGIRPGEKLHEEMITVTDA